jgi:formylglycine-generating enzyme required for sulfatase activity
MSRKIACAGKQRIQPSRAAIITLIVLIISLPAMSNQEGPPAKEKPPIKNAKAKGATRTTRPRARPRAEAPRKKINKRDEQPSPLDSLALVALRNSFVQIPAGEFLMGSDKGADDEKPVHGVVIKRGFEMSKYEIIQAQWLAVMGSNPSRFKGQNLPVEEVRWNDVQQFIQKLNQRKDGYVYRLPTEAEWEYACRAGTTTEFAFGNSLTFEDANFDSCPPLEKKSDKCFLDSTRAVGSYKPNAWGLYDMHGNVKEWCEDWYSDNYYFQPSGEGAAKGSERVVRGGSWFERDWALRSANRDGAAPEGSQSIGRIGFRLVRTRR